MRGVTLHAFYRRLPSVSSRAGRTEGCSSARHGAPSVIQFQHDQTSRETVRGRASQLPAGGRAELAGLRLESIEEADDGVEEAWGAEIERRMEDYRASRVQTISWNEVRARLHRANR